MRTERRASRRPSRAWAIGGLRGWAVLTVLLSAVQPTMAQPVTAPAALALTLADLERIALERNPTVPQAQAGLRALEHRQRQAGLYPNPLVGYEADDLNTREPGRFKNFFWFQVPIVLGGKLEKSRELAATEARLGDVNLETQRLRVITEVRMLYWEALGAARVVELKRELARITREAVEVSEELFNVGQADRPDVLEVEIQAERADLDLARAESRERRVLAMLASAVGERSLGPARLLGDLEADVPELDREAVAARVLRDSPEVKRAHLAVERARAALERVRAERVPNLFVRSKLGYNSESYAPGKDVGFEAGVEIGLPLPLFDRQQGNVAVAEADLEHARREVERLDLGLRSQLGAALKSYDDARREAARYRAEIVPRAERSVELYQASFRQMGAAYPQVLIAQRTLSQLRVEYVQSLVELRRSAAFLEGMLLAGGLEAPSHTAVQLPPPTGHLPTASGRPAD